MSDVVYLGKCLENCCDETYIAETARSRPILVANKGKFLVLDQLKQSNSTSFQWFHTLQAAYLKTSFYPRCT